MKSLFLWIETIIHYRFIRKKSRLDILVHLWNICKMLILQDYFFANFVQIAKMVMKLFWSFKRDIWLTFIFIKSILISLIVWEIFVIDYFCKNCFMPILHHSFHLSKKPIFISKRSIDCKHFSKNTYLDIFVRLQNIG